MEHTFNTNAYVEQSANYGADKVKIKLDEAAKQVTLELIDVYDAAIAGAPKLIDETFTTLPAAIEYYEEAIHQLYQGDVVRNYKRAEKTLRNPYDTNSRYNA